jgi:predicted flap endonuclease-1-like 5' DNA nuclease
MRKGYWIILVFAFWCVVSALWYMFSIKGLPQDTSVIKPSITAMAIVEIIVMITIACLLGFSLAWMMRTEPIEIMSDEVTTTKYQIRELQRTITVHKESTVNWEKIAHEAEEKAAKALLSSDHLGTRIKELTVVEEQLKRKNHDLDTKVQVLEGELDSSKFRIRILEAEVGDKNKAIGALTQELDDAGHTVPKIEHRDWSDHPFVRPTPNEKDDRDDLTEIKGIGPAFQKKLNVLDLYTFRQLSELDGESVERLADLIEVFPERIHRDNWIGQATKLYLKKIGKEA